MALVAAAAAHRRSWLGPALASASTPRVGVLAPWRSLPLLLPVAVLDLGLAPSPAGLGLPLLLVAVLVLLFLGCRVPSTWTTRRVG